MLPEFSPGSGIHSDATNKAATRAFEVDSRAKRSIPGGPETSCPSLTTWAEKGALEDKEKASGRPLRPVDTTGATQSSSLDWSSQGAHSQQQDFCSLRPDSILWQKLSENARDYNQAQDVPSPPKIPVYVMLPLDTVNARGVFQYATSQWFAKSLDYLARSGVMGVAVDVWWGGVEREPRAYDWSGYKDLFQMLKIAGLRLQVVLSFHACGANVNDIADIPLPKWVLKAGETDPDLFFADKPRGCSPGQRNKECISFFADSDIVLGGRSPLQCYEDFMISFKNTFAQELGSFVTEVVVGCGPCGELRYPSYAESNGWKFPGVGEFQCYDRRALASLARAAKHIGHPEWGYAGPHDSGHYNSLPADTPFFTDEGSWDTPYGQFFLKWYSDALIEHGNRMLSIARATFCTFLNNVSESKSLVAKPATILKSIQSWVGNTDVVLTKPSSSESFTDLCVNTGSTVSHGTGSSQSVRQSASPGSMSTAIPSSQSMDILDAIVYMGDTMEEDGDAGCLEAANGFSTIFQSTLHPCDSLRRVATMDQDGSSSPSSGSDVCVCSNADDAKGTESGTFVGEKSDCPQQWGILQKLAGFLGGRVQERECMDIRIKIAGVHWWYLSKSHGAELAAGYYNTEKRCGYKELVQMCKRYGANLTLTCIEMCDAQHPWEARCSPQGLFRQIQALAGEFDVELSGENALPLFTQGGSGGDLLAFDRIVQHSRCQPQFIDMEKNPHWKKKENNTLVKPALGSFTFLRLGEEILCPQNQGLWMQFMHGMQS